MRLGFCGTHGVGKSTLLKEMFGLPEFNGYAFISGLTRLQAANCVKINEEGDFESQKKLVKTMTHHLKILPNLVLDRTLLDIYSYTVYLRDHNLLSSQDLNYIRNRAKVSQCLFDVVFYIRPEFEIKGDDYRSDDPAFAIEVAAIMERTVTCEPLGTNKIVTLTGTTEQRLETIKGWLGENSIRHRKVAGSTQAA